MSERDGGECKLSGIKCASVEIKPSNEIASGELYVAALADKASILPIAMNGRYTAGDLGSLFIDATAREVSVNQSSSDLTGIMRESTARYHLSKLSLPDVESSVNMLLMRRGGEILPRCRLRIACDQTEIPYYGSPMAEQGEIRKGRAKHGTKRFHAYASLYVMLDGRRVTTALRYVTAGDRLPDVVTGMLAQLKAAGFAIGCLFMDRGFYSVRMVNLLKSTDTRFCMMMPQRGKTGGTRRLCTGKTRRQRYTAISVRKGVREEASYTAFVVCCQWRFRFPHFRRRILPRSAGLNFPTLCLVGSGECCRERYGE